MPGPRVTSILGGKAPHLATLGAAGGSLLVPTLPVNVMASAYAIPAELMMNRATAKDAKRVLLIRICIPPLLNSAEPHHSNEIDGNPVAWPGRKNLSLSLFSSAGVWSYNASDQTPSPVPPERNRRSKL